jgi:osmotically-inducible protein OsmY
MVGRADLVRALSTIIQRKADIERMKGVDQVSDSVIEDRLMDHVREQPWRPKWVSVTVSKGAVTLRGREPSRMAKRAFMVAAENMPGVKSVRQCFFRESFPAALRSERI